MNLVILISLILFTFFGIHSCADLQKSSPTPITKSDVIVEHGKPIALAGDKSGNEKSDDHAGDHDQDDKASSGSSIKARKGVVYNQTDDNVKSTDDVHISNDRASTTILKTSENVINATVEIPSSVKSKVKSDSDRTSSSGSDKYSPHDTKSSKTDTSSSAYTKENNSTSSNYSKSSNTISASTESISLSKSSSKPSSNKKPLVTYSVEDEPMLLKIPITRQIISPLTPTDEKLEADNPAYLPPSSDFVLDRMQSKREMYIFPLVVLIFLVPMLLGVGIIILRRVRDYWSTRHYRRMDFLVDGMYNT